MITLIRGKKKPEKYIVEKLSRQKRYLDNQMKMMEQLLKTENRWRSNEKVESTLP